MAANKNKLSFPYEIKELNPEEIEKLNKEFREGVVFVRVGPRGYLCPPRYASQAEAIYNMTLRPDDVYVTSYPRSGTTWTQELVWMIASNFDYEGSAAKLLTDRYTFLERSTMFLPAALDQLRRQCANDPLQMQILDKNKQPGVELLETQTTRRFIKTHLPLSLLPPGLPDTARVVYVARDPRDVAVSLYHFNKMISFFNFQGDFAKYWKVFKSGYDMHSPIFEHVKEAWALRNHPNMLFLFYEELQKDMPATIERVSRFLGVSCTPEQVQALTRHLHVDTFRANPSVNGDEMKNLGLFNNSVTFVRKGRSTGWREYFTGELAAEAAAWIEDNLRGTDLRFPSMEPDLQ